jgi:hypothetical protein
MIAQSFPVFSSTSASHILVWGGLYYIRVKGSVVFIRPVSEKVGLHLAGIFIDLLVLVVHYSSWNSCDFGLMFLDVPAKSQVVPISYSLPSSL